MATTVTRYRGDDLAGPVQIQPRRGARLPRVYASVEVARVNGVPAHGLYADDYDAEGYATTYSFVPADPTAADLRLRGVAERLLAAAGRDLDRPMMFGPWDETPRARLDRGLWGDVIFACCRVTTGLHGQFRSGRILPTADDLTYEAERVREQVAAWLPVATAAGLNVATARAIALAQVPTDCWPADHTVAPTEVDPDILPLVRDRLAAGNWVHLAGAPVGPAGDAVAATARLL